MRELEDYRAGEPVQRSTKRKSEEGGLTKQMDKISLFFQAGLGEHPTSNVTGIQTCCLYRSSLEPFVSVGRRCALTLAILTWRGIKHVRRGSSSFREGVSSFRVAKQLESHRRPSLYRHVARVEPAD